MVDENDGEEPSLDDFKFIHKTGYLKFDEIICRYPEFFAEFIRVRLPYDFLESLFLDPTVKYVKKFSLHTLERVSINSDGVTIWGKAYLHPKWKTAEKAKKGSLRQAKPGEEGS